MDGSLMKKHYVYVHKREDGLVFYVGKGVGRRAYTTNRRGDLWEHYVKTRCGGKHEVEIIAHFETDEEALRFEEGLTDELGSQLVNCISDGRDIDFKALNRLNLLRSENQHFVMAIKPIEASDPETAIGSYRIALKKIDDYSSIVYERGTFSELRQELRPEHSCIEVEVVNRLSLLLYRAGRFQEMVMEVDSYHEKYPKSLATRLGKTILKRRARALERAKPICGGSQEGLPPAAVPLHANHAGWWHKQRARLRKALAIWY
jgi:hypothetical protein